MMDTLEASHTLVGICVLNYHHPVETVQCIESLLRKEPPTTRILWIENDADSTRADMMAVLNQASFPWAFVEPDSQALPPSGTVGVLCNGQNLGYAAGNNPGLRLLHRLGVPYAWVLNNDMELLEGCSSDLVEAAASRPEVGAWGTFIRTTQDQDHYFGGILSFKDFSITFCRSVDELDRNPLTFVSGCSIFFRLETAEAIGFIPEDYFLYYEDASFTMELRRRGLLVSALESVVVSHVESRNTGYRSLLVEFYNRRNCWFFIQRYFPERLNANHWLLFYRLQKHLVRGKWTRLRGEALAYTDFGKGRMGPTTRKLSRETKS